MPVTEKLMPMMQNGLAKLIEECGEVLQVAGKLVQYPHLQQVGSDELHPDGTHLRTELQNEIADAIASFEFVAARLQLDMTVIDGRVSRKVALFELWDRERTAPETRPEPTVEGALRDLRQRLGLETSPVQAVCDRATHLADVPTPMTTGVQCNCAGTPPTMPVYRTEHLPTCPATNRRESL